MATREPPRNLNALNARIDNLVKATGRPIRRIQRALANTIVAQMLPPGVVKGGTAIKARVGEAASRFSLDLDVARARELNLDDYLLQLEDDLAAGWGGFTGTLIEGTPNAPEGVPDEYVMRPFRIQLFYRGRQWVTVPFELGRDEVGSTEAPEWRISDEIRVMFETLGLEDPQPFPVMALEHQIAQKLHACTYVNPKTGTNERAHDLVDLQILEQEETIDLAAVAEAAERLFASRGEQPWPPNVAAFENWDTLYAAAADDLDVIGDVESAVIWANAFVLRVMEAAEQERTV
jgi:hypothetical protein